MLNYLLKNFYPTFGQKYPVSYPFYPYFRPQKCRFSVGLKCKKWGARGDNNNLYICINFFLAFSLFKKRESVKVWKWTDFFHFFYFFSRKICKHHNSHRTFAAQFKIIARSSHVHRITIAHTGTRDTWVAAESPAGGYWTQILSAANEQYENRSKLLRYHYKRAARRAATKQWAERALQTVQ